MSARGVVAAGHPLTAEAGASVLREGGNAVDAAVAAVMTSCVTESPLTGLGAGGYMLVHNDSETVLLDFFVAAPGLSGGERGSELVPIPIHFSRAFVAGVSCWRRIVRGARDAGGSRRGGAALRQRPARRAGDARGAACP